MSSSVYAAIPVMILLGIAQTAVLPRFPIFGLIPQLPFLVVLAWGLLRGINEGLMWAFVAGFFLDVFSAGPLGATSLAFMVAVLAVTRIERALPTSRFFLPMLLAGLATFISLLLYLFVLRLLGYPANLQAAATALPPVALLHGALILPVYWLVYAINRAIWPRRVRI